MTVAGRHPERAGLLPAGAELRTGLLEADGPPGSGDYDLAGFCVGVVERDRIIDGRHIRAGDVLLGLASNGAHSNGYSLIRRVLEEAQLATDDPLIEQLLAPTRIYAKSILQLLQQSAVHGMAHITGGGLLENLPRMLPTDAGLAALINPESWQWPELFAWLAQAGNIDQTEMLRTFNCGIGYVVCVPQAEQERAIQTLVAAGERVSVLGEIVAGDTQGAANQLLIR